MKKRPKNKYAKDLRTPKYKMQVQKDRKRKDLAKRLHESFLEWCDGLR